MLATGLTQWVMDLQRPRDAAAFERDWPGLAAGLEGLRDRARAEGLSVRHQRGLEWTLVATRQAIASVPIDAARRALLADLAAEIATAVGAT
jgi:hypothetical protein